MSTGGQLNWLNGHCRISAPHNSVPVMKLIKVHDPQSRWELEELIRFHYEHDCACGIRSTGTIADFGRRLHRAQKEVWGEEPFSEEACIQWEYDLFVTNSLRGARQEKKLLKALRAELPHLTVEMAGQALDAELRVDLLILYRNEVLCGIQVKPESFQHARANVKAYQEHVHEQLDYPVFTASYGNDLEFKELSLLLRLIRGRLVI